jgi:hypothetical protein
MTENINQPDDSQFGQIIKYVLNFKKENLIYVNEIHF